MYSGSSLRGVSWKANLSTKTVVLSPWSTCSVSDTIMVSKNLFNWEYFWQWMDWDNQDLGILIPTPNVRIQRIILMKVLFLFFIWASLYLYGLHTAKHLTKLNCCKSAIMVLVIECYWMKTVSISLKIYFSEKHVFLNWEHVVFKCKIPGRFTEFIKIWIFRILLFPKNWWSLTQTRWYWTIP